jgi:hypothetical protein
MSTKWAVAGTNRPRAKTTPGTDHPVPMPPAPYEDKRDRAKDKARTLDAAEPEESPEGET